MVEGSERQPATKRAVRSGASPLAARRRRAGLVLVTPALLVLLAVVAYPIGRSIVLSFQRVTAKRGVFAYESAGLANYRRLGSDEAFRIAVKNSLFFTIVEVVAVLAIALLAALLLNHPQGRSGFFRTILLIPWAISPVANAVLWKWILHANYGALNALLRQLGLIDSYVNWLGDPKLALRMMLLADIWKSVPFITLLLLAGLQNVPGYLYRAARIDGATLWQRFRFVTLPGLRVPIAIAMVLQTIWSFKVFDLVYVLTKGGPADGTLLLNYLAYRVTFNFLDFGYGAAIANVLFLTMFVVAFAYIKLLRPGAARTAR
jgi:multiple sugar transport system permease protein